MTIESTQIIVFYILGILFFIFGLEEDRIPNNYIYLGLSFFINTIGYYLSYNEAMYVNTAYLPLALITMTIILLIKKGFDHIQQKTNDDYKEDDD